jgi:hypothetical protein
MCWQFSKKNLKNNLFFLPSFCYSVVGFWTEKQQAFCIKLLLWRLSCALYSICQHPKPLQASSTPVVVTGKNVSKHCQMFPREQNCPWLRTTSIYKLHWEKVDLKGKERLAYAIQGTESRALQVLYPTMELHPKFFVVVFFFFFFFFFL